MKKIMLLFYIAFLISLSSAQQVSKVYVLSEGSGSPGSAKLSMLDLQNTSYTENIFNPGNLGLFPDGLIYHENHLYLTEQGNFGGSGKIYKLDTLGNVLNSTTVGRNPYSLTISNDKIYITNGPASNVSVLNLNDLSLVTTVTVGVYPQEILAKNNKVFVANKVLLSLSPNRITCSRKCTCVPEFVSRERRTMGRSSPPTSFQLLIFPLYISDNC